MNLQNLIDYCKGQGLPSPFSGAYVPAPLNIDTCLSAIMIRCGLLTPVYNDPETFTNVVTNWFSRKQWTFEHLINIIQAEYSPIENYVRYDNKTLSKGTSETHTGGYKDTQSGKDTTQLSGKDTTELSGTDERNIRDGGTDTTTNEISAFNTSGYQSDNKSSTGYGKTVDDDVTYGKQEDITYGKKEDITYGRTVSRTYEQDKTTYTGSDTETISGHGNIGVTTNQQMIEQELALLRHFDIYGYIAEQFEYDNMLMIY